jgi:dihydroorotate dehydrogenase
MTTKRNTPERHRQVQEQEVEQILKIVWETAARRNPMVLVKMADPNMPIEHLRRMIRDCLEKGLSATETCDHAVRELLNSAIRNRQPHDTCHDIGAEKEPAS